MSVTPAPATVAVSYQAPARRALAASQRTALAGAVATVVVAAFPLVSTFVAKGDLSATALRVFGLGLAGTLLTAAFAWAQKYLEANGEPVVPVSEPPTPAPAASAVFAPPITAETLRGLLETVDVLQEWTRPVAPPPATIAPPLDFRPLTQQVAAPVKRSHHAAKAPAVVAPIDVRSDS
jgi:hypothetical protein